MEIIETSIPDLLIIKPKVFEDTRGFFLESYNQKTFQEAGLNYEFVQDNHSKSVKGVLRGLHYQVGPYAQAKLVRVLKGSVLDVAVDIRKGSPTYGQWESLELSAENKLNLLIPKGFAHGFLVLSDEAEFFYKCDQFYSKPHEAGIRYDDPELSIDWGSQIKDFILSEKDKALPNFSKAKNNFEY